MFHNDADGSFTDVTVAAGVFAPDDAAYWEASWGDWNNDGHLDPFIGSAAKNYWFQNNSDGTFTNVAGDLGIAGDLKTVAGLWGDYDNGGDLDLLCLQPGHGRRTDRQQSLPQ